MYYVDQNGNIPFSENSTSLVKNTAILPESLL